MTLSFRQLIEMAGRSIRAPREGAAEVLSLGVPREAIWLAIGLVAVLYTALNQITVLILVQVYSDILRDYPQVTTDFPEFAEIYSALSASLEANLVVAAALQFVLQLATIVAIHRAGQAFGGTGSLSETAVLMSWLHIVAIFMAATLVAILMVIPILGFLGLFPFLVIVVRMLVSFTGALHGFRLLHQAVLTLVLAYAVVTVFRAVLVGLAGAGAGLPTGEV